MEVGQMQRQWVEYIQSLFLEGLLDELFLQLMNLQDESSPHFVVEVLSLFFENSENLLNDVTSALEQPSVDFRRIRGSYVHQLMGSSSSVQNGCIAFRNYCEEENIEGCIGCLQQLKKEFYLVRNKLETLLAMGQQLEAAGGSIPKLGLSLYGHKL